MESPVRTVPKRNRAAQRLTCIPGRSQVRQPCGIVTFPLTPTHPSGFDEIDTGTRRCGRRREYNRALRRDLNRCLDTPKGRVMVHWSQALQRSRNACCRSRVDREGSGTRPRDETAGVEGGKQSLRSLDKDTLSLALAARPPGRCSGGRRVPCRESAGFGAGCDTGRHVRRSRQPAMP